MDHALSAPPVDAVVHADAVVHQVEQRLTALAERPVWEHVALLDQVHRLLQDALASLDEA